MFCIQHVEGIGAVEESLLPRAALKGGDSDQREPITTGFTFHPSMAIAGLPFASFNR